jgi:hypothetical protein
MLFSYKHFLAIFSISLVIAISAVNTSSAHPGNTSSDGGHYCWTNCEYWGYEYGTRHYHGGGYSSPSVSDYSQGRTNGKNHAEVVNKEYILSVASIDAKNKGYKDGEADEFNASSIYDAPPCENEVKYSGETTSSYRSAFQSAYESACYTVYTDEYEKAYDIAYAEGQLIYEQVQKEKAIAEQEKKDRENGYWMVGIIGVLGMLGIMWLRGNAS